MCVCVYVCVCVFVCTIYRIVACSYNLCFLVSFINLEKNATSKVLLA